MGTFNLCQMEGLWDKTINIWDQDLTWCCSYLLFFSTTLRPKPHLVLLITPILVHRKLLQKFICGFFIFIFKGIQLSQKSPYFCDFLNSTHLEHYWQLFHILLFLSCWVRWGETDRIPFQTDSPPLSDTKRGDCSGKKVIAHTLFNMCCSDAVTLLVCSNFFRFSIIPCNHDIRIF